MNLIIREMFWQVFQVVSCGFISSAVETNFEMWFAISGRFGIISSNLRLYMYFRVEMCIRFVGWFIEIVWLKKYGIVFGAIFSSFS